MRTPPELQDDTPAGLLADLARSPLAIREAALGALVERVAGIARLGLAFGMPADRRRLDVRGGVAVIPITGPIRPRGSALGAFLGFASVDGLRELVDEAFGREEVTAIVFEVDSPGGLVGGVADLAAHIRSKRGEKPMTAVARESMYSAAYWLASAADEIVVTQTAGVGSIGVLAVHWDDSKMWEEMGSVPTIISSGKKKAQFSSLVPLTPEAREELQASVDRVAALFFRDVAKQRAGLTAAAIQALEGGEFEGKAAVEAGLADRVDTFDAVLRRAAGRRASRAPQQRGAEKMGDEKVVSIEDHRAAVDQAASTARTEAEAQAKTDREAETARVQGINQVCEYFGCKDKAGEYIATGKSADAIRSEIVAAIAKRSQDQQISGVHGLGGSGDLGASYDPAQVRDRYVTRCRERNAASQAAAAGR